jgi:hypothetical protein
MVAISLGPDSVQETIRTALAMGADRGLHLKTDGQPYDTLSVAQALAAELKGYDLILLGKMAIDDYNHAMAPALAELCWGDAPVDRRIDVFVARLAALGDVEMACDLAGEVLHHVFPDRWWLFSRWMWSPRLRTGAVALVTTDADLSGETPGETYLKLGRALVMLRASAEAGGLLDLGEEPWNLDVLLACVYCVYLYTITRLRMTQEFNKVIPPLPELARRFLGVHRLEVQEQ